MASFNYGLVDVVDNEKTSAEMAFGTLIEVGMNSLLA